MKVKEIVKQTKEYERLDVLIRAIKGELGIENEESTFGFEGNVIISGGNLASISLPTILKDYLKDDLEILFRKHLKELKKQRDELEV